MEFTQRLIFPQGQDGGDERCSENVALAAKLARVHPTLLERLVGGGLSCLGEVISIAREAHVSSDDGFVVPSVEFMEKFLHWGLGSLGVSPVGDEDSGILETQARALAYLKFYEAFLMTESQGGILERSAVGKMIYFLLVLLGHSNRTLAFTSGRVLRLLLQTLTRTGVDSSEGREVVREMMYSRLRDLTAGAGREGHELYTIWLQWVSTSVCEPSQTMLRQDEYWAMIQVYNAFLLPPGLGVC